MRASKFFFFLALAFWGSFCWLAAKPCTVSVVQNVSFGNYHPLNSGQIVSAGRFSVTCVQESVVTISILPGGSGSFHPRLLSGGIDRISYNLFIDGSYTTVWGDGTESTSTLTFSLPAREAHEFVVYAATQQGQDITAGAYMDIVTVLIDDGKLTDTASLQVDALAVREAMISGIQHLNFGVYDPTSTQSMQAVAAVGVRATKSLSYGIYISSDRVLLKGSEGLIYQLYSDPLRTQVWGNSFQTGNFGTAVNNLERQYSIYGSIPASQDVSAGEYADSVVVTVEW